MQKLIQHLWFDKEAVAAADFYASVFPASKVVSTQKISGTSSGVSPWQLIYTNPDGDDRPLIIPSFLLVGDVCGKTKEASDFYLSVFKNTKQGAIACYPAGSEPDKGGTTMFTDFKLEGQWFAAMDSAYKHDFHFNEAVSLMVNCKD